MPIYLYKCIYCQNEFDQLRKFNNSGKSKCPKCKNVSFKIPAIFAPRIFKKREFGDGTTTPDHVRTHSQEKKWMKEEKVIYDKPLKKRRRQHTSMEEAFRKAHDKCKEGYVDEHIKRAAG